MSRATRGDATALEDLVSRDQPCRTNRYRSPPRIRVVLRRGLIQVLRSQNATCQRDAASAYLPTRCQRAAVPTPSKVSTLCRPDSLLPTAGPGYSHRRHMQALLTDRRDFSDAFMSLQETAWHADQYLASHSNQQSRIVVHLLRLLQSLDGGGAPVPAHAAQTACPHGYLRMWSVQ